MQSHIGSVCKSSREGRLNKVCVNFGKRRSCEEFSGTLITHSLWPLKGCFTGYLPFNSGCFLVQQILHGDTWIRAQKVVVSFVLTLFCLRLSALKYTNIIN
jgi:hypothetical protein